MSGIRVTYSGLISLAAGTLTLITGLIFTLVIARGLSVTEYGTWGVIWGLLAYVLILDPVVSYWATREAAQGTRSARTALAASGGTSAIAAAAYIAIAYAYAPSGGAELGALALAAVLVPVEILRALLAALTLSHRPHAVEYALLAGELVKAALAFVLIFPYGMGIAGAIAAALIGGVANIALLAAYLGRHLGGSLEAAYVKKWMRLAWIPSWGNLVPLLTRSDVIVFSIATGSVVGVAYWIAARTIAAVTAHAARMNAALYPKLLGGGAREGLQENLTIVLYIMFALAAAAAALSGPALWLLGPQYAAAAAASVILVGLISMRTLSNMFSRALIGIEDVDVVSSRASAHLRSRLFTIPALTIAQRVAYLVALAAMLAVLVPMGTGVAELVTYWAALALAAQIPHFVRMCVLVRREFRPSLNAARIAKYAALAAAAFVIMSALSEYALVRDGGAFEFAPKLVGVAAVGIASYVGMTYAADSKTRRLVAAVADEIRGRRA